MQVTGVESELPAAAFRGGALCSCWAGAAGGAGGLDHDDAETDYADACELPDRITSRRYDLVFSNSVLEHVGGYERRRRMAEAVRAIAPNYWAQTPYRYFPVEPHWIAPGMQFLPVPARVFVARKWPLAYNPGRTYEEAMKRVLTTDLVGRAEMRYLFPDATIRAERLAGLTKSIIAVGRG
ncbi:MAG: hypothetical protein QOE51_93 [Actinoplanes sp.]|nr:hypothetical protein [Actinoplanes sp.]